ncbi:hypothetical protein [Sinimarinibacterium flocculans]|uniref:hypothetical protein n=1 Tax=Sinimarinibacterium flocculans TaxID=985250 RepID=UPI002492A33F|nr:hypothetical protein [Sinimarinibacterium flocculans]
MKPSDEPTGPSGRDVVSAEAGSTHPGSHVLSFPVFNRLRQETQENVTGQAIPDAELLNDSGMRKAQD